MTFKYSICIGINRYQHHDINALKYAVNDATTIRQFLTKGIETPIDGLEASQEMAAGRMDDHILLCNEDATRGNILEAIDLIRAKCAQSIDEHSVLFYYAGHGCTEPYNRFDERYGNMQANAVDDQHVKYIAPYDTEVGSLISSAVRMDILAFELNKIECKNMLIILDCCHSGGGDKPGRRTFSLPNTRGTASIKTGYLDVLNEKGGRIVMAACAGHDLAYEREGNGVFTKFILEGLEGAADYHKKGEIDDFSLFYHAYRKTVDDTGGKQRPVRNFESYSEPIRIAVVTKPEYDLLSMDDDARKSLGKEVAYKFGNYNVKNVIVAEDASITELGRTAAKHLEQIIQVNYKIAVSCGATLIETISRLERMNNKGAKIYPLNGSPRPDVRLSDSMVLSYILWSKFSDTASTTTHVIPTGIPKKLLDENEYFSSEIMKTVRDIIEEAKNADLFLFGIGVPKPTNKNITENIKDSEKGFSYFQQLGAVGELNYRLFDANGVFLDERADLSKEDRTFVEKYNSRNYSLSTAALRGIKQTIVVAGGEDKREAILAAVKGGLVRTLITDVHTAYWLYTKQIDIPT